MLLANIQNTGNHVRKCFFHGTDFLFLFVRFYFIEKPMLHFFFSKVNEDYNSTKYFEQTRIVFSKKVIFCIGSRDIGRVLKRS